MQANVLKKMSRQSCTEKLKVTLLTGYGYLISRNKTPPVEKSDSNLFWVHIFWDFQPRNKKKAQNFLAASPREFFVKKGRGLLTLGVLFREIRYTKILFKILGGFASSYHQHVNQNALHEYSANSHAKIGLARKHTKYSLKTEGI